MAQQSKDTASEAGFHQPAQTLATGGGLARANSVASSTASRVVRSRPSLGRTISTSSSASIVAFVRPSLPERISKIRPSSASTANEAGWSAAWTCRDWPEWRGGGGGEPSADQEKLKHPPVTAVVTHAADHSGQPALEPDGSGQIELRRETCLADECDTRLHAQARGRHLLRRWRSPHPRQGTVELPTLFHHQWCPRACQSMSSRRA